MNHPNPGGFPAWGGGGGHPQQPHPQQPQQQVQHPQQQQHPHAPNNPQLQQFQQMQQQLLFQQQHHQNSQGGHHHQMTGGHNMVGMDLSQGNNHMSYQQQQQQLPSQQQGQQQQQMNPLPIHDQGAAVASQGMMNPNSWMQQAQQQQQLSAPAAQAAPQTMMTMMGGGVGPTNNQGGIMAPHSSQQAQQQQQQQQQLYWNVLQSQQQQQQAGGNPNFPMVQQQQPQPQPNQQQLQSHLQQMQQMQHPSSAAHLQQQQQQMPNQHQGSIMSSRGLPQAAVNNEGGGMTNIAQPHPAMNNQQQQQLQQLFSMQQQNPQQGSSNNTSSATATSSGQQQQPQQQQQLHYRQNQGQGRQQQLQQSQQQQQQPHQDKSSSSQQRPNQAQLLLQQQNLISQLQRRIQQQRQHPSQNNNSSTPAAAATAAATAPVSPPASSSSSSNINYMVGMMQQQQQQGEVSQLQPQQQSSQQQHPQLQMHHAQNSQQQGGQLGLFGGGVQGQQQPQGNVNTNEQQILLLMAQQQQQQGQLRPDALQTPTSAVNVSSLQQHQQQFLQQQAQAGQAGGFQRQTSSASGQQQQPQQQQQQIELMMQRQQQLQHQKPQQQQPHLGNNAANQHHRGLNPQQQKQHRHDLNANKVITNDDLSSFSTQIPPKNDIMNASIASITSQQKQRLTSAGSTLSQQHAMQSSTASTPVTTNHAVDSSRVVINPSQQQQQQFIVSQLTQGTVNMGGGQVVQNDPIPSASNAPVPAGITTGGASVSGNSTGDDSQDEPSLDQRVKQFELMQQQQLSIMRQQEVSRGGSISIGDASVATQPPPSGVDELLPSRSNSIVIEPPQPPPPQQQQQQQQQQQLVPQQQQKQDNTASSISSVAGASFSGNDDSSESPEVPEPLSSLLPARAGSPGSLGVAEPDPIVDGATIIRSEGAINVIAPVRRSVTAAGDNDEPGAHTSSSVGADQGESGSEQPFLDGHFAGGWQSNVDLPDRRQIIFSIIKVIERKRPDTNRMSQNRLPLMAKKLEEHLYRSAHLKDAYIDLASLKKRLHLIAKGVGIPKSNTPSVSSVGTDPSVMFMTSPTGNSTNGIVATPASVVNLLQPVAATSESSIKSLTLNLGTATSSNYSDEVESDEPLPQSKKEQLPDRPWPRMQENSQRERKNDDDVTAKDTELDRLNKNLAKATAQYHSSDDVSSMEIDDDENSEKKRVILQQQQRRLLLLRHASKCREGLHCRVKFCPQMVTLWKHMKTCRDKNCKAAHCLSSRCVLNHYRICKSEGLTSSCGICAPVMKHIRLKESSSTSQDPDLLNQMGALSDAERYDEMPVDTEAEEQDSSDSFKALKEALVSGVPNESSDETAVCAPQPEEKHTAQQLKTKQNLLNQVQQQKVKLTSQNQKLQQQLKGASTPLQLEQLQKQQNILQHLNHQFQQQQVVLESEIQRQGEEKSDSQQQSPGKNLKNQEGKRTSESVDGGSKDLRPNKVLKRDSSTVSASASVASEVSTTKKSSSLITSMQISDIEAHLDSLVNSGRLTPRNISRKCLPIVKRLRDHENGWVFSEPVDPIELGIHDYFDIVEHPMDLDLVTKKLENGVYWDITSFRKDTRLVFENAILYNGKDSDVGMMAKELLEIFEQDMSNCFKGLNADEETKKADSCSLCGNHRRLYELPSLFCSGTCGRNIRRNAVYFTDRMKQNQWCEACHAEQKDDEPLLLDNGKETKKAHLQQMKNDKSPEEKWVQCDKCQDWVHQVCALFNGTQNYKSASFTCPKCYIKFEANPTPSTAPKGAAELLQCKLSESIEKGIAQTLSKEYEKIAEDRDCTIAQVEKSENLYVRVVSNLDKKQKVREGMRARYSKKNYPSEFPVKSKCILLFQKIHGVDVLLFSMYVYEYGDECPAPNRRRVYISYLDSVRYLTPAQYRTAIYQSVLIEYLRFVKMRGFHTAHIWSCPPAKGDEYIFYCHPVNQLTPRNDMLCAWYNNTLQKAKAEGIALDIRSLYDDYFKDNVVNRRTGEPFDPTSLPYFDGDYVPGEIEKIIKDLDEDDNRREGTKLKDASKVVTAPSKSEGKRAGTRSNPGRLVNQGRDKVMNRLDLILSRMKENFFVVQLLSNDYIDAVEGTASITALVDSSPSDDDSAKSTRTIGKNPYILDLAEKKDAKASNASIPLCQQIISVSTKDEDPLMEQECFETRLQFLNYCQRNNYQFDELRRAKYSSTMVLAYLHNPREEKEQQIKAHLEVIAHAASCQGCVSKNCQRMKQLFGHVRGCELTYKRGCKICTRLFMLLIKHARDCPTDGTACPIPFCERIKERNRMLLKQQRLMDDRRRNAQNTRAKEDSA